MKSTQIKIFKNINTLLLTNKLVLHSCKNNRFSLSTSQKRYINFLQFLIKTPQVIFARLVNLWLRLFLLLSMGNLRDQDDLVA